MYRRHALIFGMHVDLLTLYFLRSERFSPVRDDVLGASDTPTAQPVAVILAAGFGTLALGCIAVLLRHDLPGALGSAIANLVMLCGYLLVLAGVASLRGRQYRAASAGCCSPWRWSGWPAECIGRTPSELRQRAPDRAHQRPDRVGDAALRGDEGAPCAAHRGRGGGPACADLRGPDLRPAVAGDGRRGAHANARQPDHDV